MELIKQSAILRNTIIKKLLYEKKKNVLEGKIKQNVSEEKIYNMIDSLQKKDYIFSKTLLKELSEGLRVTQLITDHKLWMMTIFDYNAGPKYSKE